jgi:hypothetical protein
LSGDDTFYDQESSFRVMSSDWSLVQRAVFFLFSLGVIAGALSFLACDLTLVAAIADAPFSDSRSWVLVMALGFLVSMQLGWGLIVWQVYHSQNVIRAAIIAILPMLLTSLPLGAIVYAELTKEPPPPVPVVY